MFGFAPSLNFPATAVIGNGVKQFLVVLPISGIFPILPFQTRTNHFYTMAKHILTIVLLVAFLSAGWGQKGISSENYSEKVAKDFIQQVPNPDSIHWETDPNHFSWQAGYIMFAMEKMWRATGDSVYGKWLHPQR
ncbi:MAG: hypothetical protein ACOC30_02865 [Marinilabilia sp.]